MSSKNGETLQFFRTAICQMLFLLKSTASLILISATIMVSGPSLAQEGFHLELSDRGLINLRYDSFATVTSDRPIIGENHPLVLRNFELSEYFAHNVSGGEDSVLAKDGISLKRLLPIPEFVLPSSSALASDGPTVMGFDRILAIPINLAGEPVLIGATPSKKETGIVSAWLVEARHIQSNLFYYFVFAKYKPNFFPRKFDHQPNAITFGTIGTFGLFIVDKRKSKSDKDYLEKLSADPSLALKPFVFRALSVSSEFGNFGLKKGFSGNISMFLVAKGELDGEIVEEYYSVVERQRGVELERREVVKKEKREEYVAARYARGMSIFLSKNCTNPDFIARSIQTGFGLAASLFNTFEGTGKTCRSSNGIISMDFFVSTTRSERCVESGQLDTCFLEFNLGCEMNTSVANDPNFNEFICDGVESFFQPAEVVLIDNGVEVKILSLQPL